MKISAHYFAPSDHSTTAFSPVIPVTANLNVGPRLRVFIADDHALVREGLKMLISTQSDMEVVGEAGDGEVAFRLARELRPDVVVMDVSMPEVNGAQATERLRAACPKVKVLALSAYQDEAHVRQLLASGAVGYVLKKAVADELAGAIRAVSRGQIFLDSHLDPMVVARLTGKDEADGDAALSPREREVLMLTAWGHTNKEIAAKLHLSVKTVEGHKTRLMEKLELESRAELVRYALRRGWLRDE